MKWILALPVPRLKEVLLELRWLHPQSLEDLHDEELTELLARCLLYFVAADACALCRLARRWTCSASPSLSLLRLSLQPIAIPRASRELALIPIPSFVSEAVGQFAF